MKSEARRIDPPAAWRHDLGYPRHVAQAHRPVAEVYTQMPTRSLTKRPAVRTVVEEPDHGVNKVADVRLSPELSFRIRIALFGDRYQAVRDKAGGSLAHEF